MSTIPSFSVLLFSFSFIFLKCPFVNHSSQIPGNKEKRSKQLQIIQRSQEALQGISTPEHSYFKIKEPLMDAEIEEGIRGEDTYMVSNSLLPDKEENSNFSAENPGRQHVHQAMLAKSARSREHTEN